MNPYSVFKSPAGGGVYVIRGPLPDELWFFERKVAEEVAFALNYAHQLGEDTQIPDDLGLISVTWHKPSTTERFSCWARRVYEVLPRGDMSKAASFRGFYLTDGEEIRLREGALVVEVRQVGYRRAVAQLLQAERNGTLQEVSDAYDWHQEFDAFREVVKQTLAAQKEPSGETTWPTKERSG